VFSGRSAASRSSWRGAVEVLVAEDDATYFGHLAGFVVYGADDEAVDLTIEIDSSRRESPTARCDTTVRESRCT
jgi:hypothetical protein